MCFIYRIPEILNLKCENCSIDINKICTENSRPTGYILMIDNVVFHIDKIDDCKILYKKLIELNNPLVYKVINVLKEFLITKGIPI